LIDQFNYKDTSERPGKIAVKMTALKLYIARHVTVGPTAISVHFKRHVVAHITSPKTMLPYLALDFAIGEVINFEIDGEYVRIIR
jgi:hypothetical protein